MSIQLAAPFEGPKTITILPNPDFGDEEAIDTTLNYAESMDGTPYTYVERSGNFRIRMQFTNQGRGKMLEVQEFLQFYAGEEIKLTDHNDRIWQVVYVPNQTIFTHDKRSYNSGGPRKEAGSFSLEFTGVQIA